MHERRAEPREVEREQRVDQVQPGAPRKGLDERDDVVDPPTGGEPVKMRVEQELQHQRGPEDRCGDATHGEQR